MQCLSSRRHLCFLVSPTNTSLNKKAILILFHRHILLTISVIIENVYLDKYNMKVSLLTEYHIDLLIIRGKLNQ